MAKKLKRVRTPLWLTFVELLVPWIAMGLSAVAASSAGAPAYVIFILAIGAALLTTWLVHKYEKARRRQASSNER